jgi:hypothetical protein
MGHFFNNCYSCPKNLPLKAMAIDNWLKLKKRALKDIVKKTPHKLYSLQGVF